MCNGRYILTFPFLLILGDGTLDFQEFLKVVTHKGPGDDNSDIMEAFKMIDKDGDSQLSADELRHVMRNIGENMTEEDIEEMIREADIDGDGKISYEGNRVKSGNFGQSAKFGQRPCFFQFELLE